MKLKHPNIFDPVTVEDLKIRIGHLNPSTSPEWGKMNASQMLAHVCVPYEIAFDKIHPKPSAIMRWVLNKFVKPGVVNEKPYPRNAKTAPAFIIKGDRDFNKEKGRLLAYLDKCKDLGASHFDGLAYPNFGKMTLDEWNSLFYKHLDHHLTQFNV